MRIANILAAALLAAELPALAQPPAPCPLRGAQAFARKADLPAGAEAALPFRMAERGTPFQATDVLGPPPRPPSARFISARRNGCTLEIRFEQGGIARTVQIATMVRRGGRWLFVRRQLVR